MAVDNKERVGATGRSYRFEKLFQDRPHMGHVSGNDRYVLKDIPEAIFAGFKKNIQPNLPESPYYCLPCDEIPDQRILVYKYLQGDLLSLVENQIPLQYRKQILKASLRGIAQMHEQDIIHLDIKPDNIMVDFHQNGRDPVIKGMLPGNDNWRSPEAHVRGELNKPTDMFFFGAVCIYSVLGSVIFGPDEDFEKHAAHEVLPIFIRLQRQVSYFADREGLNGLMKHLSDSEDNCKLLGMLWEDRIADYHPYKLFAEWPNIEDVELKDLIAKMMSLDPEKRITAHAALEYPWFANVLTV
ncbi:serine/threonine protein kinase [Tothia fuscella]|uniref:Serine/threonine protein kinase n=1 Tax=Tothia fuscella TaxID=1048955 RepID=A0A9P4NM86_9PEZI|nr:serine/threonine protein kinase [Tothia fuscella]